MLLPPSPNLLIPFSSEINPLGIECLTFLRQARNSGFRWQGGNTCACHCETRIGSLAIPVVKIVSQRQKLRIDNGKTNLSIDLCLNASLRRTPVCPRKSGMCIIFQAPLGKLFCGLSLEGEACTGCRPSSSLQQKINESPSCCALEPCI